MDNIPENKLIIKEGFVTKDGRPFSIIKEEIPRSWLTVYNFIVKDCQSQEIGFLRCSVEKEKAFLNNIQVEEESYLNQGVGHMLITEFENDLREMGVSHISGKYYPEGIGGSLSESFYKRHGYEVVCYDQGDWEVQKTLDLENFKNHKVEENEFGES